MRRLLMVAYYFPPIGGIGSVRLTRFAELLPEFGWDVTVLAPRETPHAADPELQFPEERVIRSRSVEVSRLKRLVPRPRRVCDREGRARLDEAIRTGAGLLFPDAQVGWLPGALVVGRRALRRQRFDAVLSSSFPITAHLIARGLSRAGGAPWIAEFRDPWSGRLPSAYPLRARARALERSIAREAERLVMPTPTWARYFGDAWDTDIAVIPNGHDAYPAPPQPPPVPILTHLGTIYPRRQDPAPVFTAIARLVRSGDIPEVTLRFIGELPQETRRALIAAGLEDRVEVTGFVPHARAMELCASSSMVFACGVGSENALDRGSIPAKVFEYFASGVAMLYLGDPDDDAGKIVEGEAGCYVVRPDDDEGLEAALSEGLRGERYARDPNRHSRRRRAEALAAVLDSAVRQTA